MTKLVWRLKVVAELRPGVVRETEVARIERDAHADLADLGLRLAEMKQLTAALQAEIVPVQVAVVGELGRCCASCGRRLASKGHYSCGFARCSARRAAARPTAARLPPPGRR